MDKLLDALIVHAGDNLAVLVLLIVVVGLFYLLREQMAVNRGVAQTLTALGEIITQLRIEHARSEARK